MGKLPTFLKTALATLALGAILGLMPVDTFAPGTTGQAIARDKDKKERKTRRVQVMSEQVGRRLNKASEFMTEEEWIKAVEQVDSVKRMRSRNSYDTAQMWRMYGYIYAQTDRYEDATAAFENVLAQNALDLRVEDETIYYLAQLYMATENFDAGLRHLVNWFTRVESPSPQAYLLAAQGYALIDDFKSALPYVLDGIETARTQGLELRENWFQLKMAIHFELDDFVSTADTLKELITMWPKKTYWLQLSGIFGELEREKEQLAIMVIADTLNLLTKSSEVENLSQLYLYHDIPYTASVKLGAGLKSEIVDRNKKNLELHSMALMAAQEIDKAIPVLKEAASVAEDGALYLRLGQAYINREEWADAITALKEALEDSDLERPDQAQVLLGMAEFNNDQFADAKRTFRIAARDERSARSARQWIRHVETEEQKAKLAVRVGQRR